MPKFKTSKRKDPYSFEINGELYRNKGGAFIKKDNGSFVRVGSGKGKYSLKIVSIRRKRFL